MEKLGARQFYHHIFKWIQFQRSMLKSDLGIIIFLVITLLVFDRDELYLTILDIVFVIFSILLFVFFKRNVFQ